MASVMSNITSILAIAVFVSVSADPNLSFRGSGQMKSEDVLKVLEMEEGHHTKLLDVVENELEQMFASLPKNQHGHLDHGTVRYALHRFFVKRHGWFIRGLEPGNATWTPQRQANGELPPAWVQEWVPNFLQDRMERLGHHGATLHDLAAMAASIEDIVFKEVDIRLRKIYEVHNRSTALPLQRAFADEVLSTYYITFLLANNLTANNTAHLKKKKAVFTRRYRGYAASNAWFEKIVDRRIGSDTSVDFPAVSQVVADIGLKYHTFNQIECNDLRSTLQRMESKRPGRVRLSVLYKQSRFTHWRFTEKPEYLKTLGALDDTDPTQLSLITANYVMARPNCLDASNYYSLCCTNACEDLMSHLESKVGSSTASPVAVANLIAMLPSDTVQAPRELPLRLIGRLDEIATLHNGVVPLHGRLFAQWMHHAYPRECPFPHEAGTISPQTAEEWSASTGESEQSSQEERQKVMDDDVCSVSSHGKVECGDESADELPWNPNEELLGMHHAQLVEIQEHRDDFSVRDISCIIVFCILIAGLVLGPILKHQSGEGEHRHWMLFRTMKNTLLAFAVFLGFLLLVLMNVFDQAIFFLALGLCMAIYLASSLMKGSTGADNGNPTV